MSFEDRDSSIKRTFVEANGVTLNVVEKGEGPAVLFVHGFPGGWRDWRRQMDAVAAARYGKVESLYPRAPRLSFGAANSFR